MRTLGVLATSCPAHLHGPHCFLRAGFRRAVFQCVLTICISVTHHQLFCSFLRASFMLRLELQAGMTQRSACRQGLVSLSLPPSWGNECYLGALSLAGHGFMPSSIHIININKMGVIILVDRVILRI